MIFSSKKELNDALVKIINNYDSGFTIYDDNGFIRLYNLKFDQFI